MNKLEILKTVDATLLSPTTTEQEIKQLCTDAINFECVSVCIPPNFVAIAKKHAQNKIAVCTVVGFPLGYQTTESKIFETKDAIINGVNEIDMVINLGWLKDKKFELIKNEIEQIKKECGKHILKVIIEACLLTKEEKIEMCKIVSEAGADFIKTSTGFSTSGATIEDVKLFKKYIGKNVKIKAAGGISTFEIAEEFIKNGANRLGSSRLIGITKSEN